MFSSSEGDELLLERRLSFSGISIKELPKRNVNFKHFALVCANIDRMFKRNIDLYYASNCDVYTSGSVQHKLSPVFGNI